MTAKPDKAKAVVVGGRRAWVIGDEVLAYGGFVSTTTELTETTEKKGKKT